VSPTVARARRIRLDQLIVERGLAANRSRAQALLLAARVRVGEGDAARADRKPGDLVDPSTPVRIVSREPYVSRGGHKLAAALDAFGIDPADRVCLDVGASTGGFTDVLLQRGATRVYALDVGRGQLADTLRANPRVVSMERTNARTLGPGVLPEPVSLAVVDVSFISLARVLVPIAGCFDRAVGGSIVALVKPQFEAGRGATERGVVRDPAIHREVLDRVAREAAERGLEPGSLVASPILGPEGNREFLMELEVPAGWVGAPTRDTNPIPAARSAALPDDWPSRVADVIRG
jgi:23S rRNA (cytidine1920-2'-O)/16S rRNA (cytidine1409-2'-O)-methyltransferase